MQRVCGGTHWLFDIASVAHKLPNKLRLWLLCVSVCVCGHKPGPRTFNDMRETRGARDERTSVSTGTLGACYT